jgi:hypothetical protein
MTGQTFAILLDTYRELNAKRLFWLVLGLSALVVVAFLFVTVDAAGGVALFGKNTGFFVEDRGLFFTELFVNYGIGVWLAFGATILAIISTAGVFPDLIAGGSVDLYLSKPMGRLRLFLTKYAAALLFVALQIAVFCGASYAVIGFRGGVWEPRIWLGVPVVVCFFSYLYAVSVLFGVLTRSTVAAVLLTVVAWFLVFLVHFADIGVMTFKNAADREYRAAEPTLQMLDGQIADIERKPAGRRTQLDNDRLSLLTQQRDELRATRSGAARENLALAQRIIFGFKTVLPKTTETTQLLNRWLLPPPEPLEEREGRPPRHRPINKADARETELELRDRPATWVIGTSLAFEAVVLGIAAWVFCRRDY